MSEEIQINSKELCLLYFTEIDPEQHTWKCKCKKTRVQDPKAGYGNLKSHILSSHSDYKQIYAEYVRKKKETESMQTEEYPESSQKALKQGTVDIIFDDVSNNIFRWLDWIVESELTLSFCENPKTRQNTKLKDISNKTLKKYGFGVEKEVQEKIIKILGNATHIAFAFDGWSSGSTHFIGLFATIPPKDKESPVPVYLLRFAPMVEGSYTAVAHKRFVEDTMKFYNIPHSKLTCLIGDNCSTNKCLADLMSKPLSGCRSHRFNIAMENFIDKTIKDPVNSVHKLMKKLKTLKGAAKLKKFTSYTAKTRNVTRWSSATAMIERFLLIKPHLPNLDPKLQEFVPSPREIKKLTENFEMLKKLNKVTISLQSKQMTLRESENSFRKIIKGIPTFDFKKYISLDAEIVHNKDFESAIIKIQESNECDLTEDEKEAVACLQKPTEDDDDCMEIDQNDSDEFVSPPPSKKSRKDTYVDTRFILPTSNDVERLFSMTKRVFNPLRQSMNHQTLQMLIFLKVNRQLWDVYTVAKIKNEPTKESQADKDILSLISSDEDTSDDEYDDDED